MSAVLTSNEWESQFYLFAKRPNRLALLERTPERTRSRVQKRFSGYIKGFEFKLIQASNILLHPFEEGCALTNDKFMAVNLAAWNLYGQLELCFYKETERVDIVLAGECNSSAYSTICNSSKRSWKALEGYSTTLTSAINDVLDSEVELTSKEKKSIREIQRLIYWLGYPRNIIRDKCKKLLKSRDYKKYLREVAFAA